MARVRADADRGISPKTPGPTGERPQSAPAWSRSQTASTGNRRDLTERRAIHNDRRPERTKPPATPPPHGAPRPNLTPRPAHLRNCDTESRCRHAIRQSQYAGILFREELLATATAKPGDTRSGGDRLPRVNSTPLLCECEPSGQLGSGVVFSRETAGWAGEAGAGSRFDDTIPPIPARSVVNCPPQAQDRDLDLECERGLQAYWSRARERKSQRFYAGSNSLPRRPSPQGESSNPRGLKKSTGRPWHTFGPNCRQTKAIQADE